MLAMGFSSGLPLYLTGSTLAAWMTNEGVSLKTIGIFSLVGVSYTFKFAWSPLMDRYFPPFLGRRRGWLVVTQVLLAVALFAMGQVNPQTDPVLMAALAALVAFFSASQDIVADAYRTDLLTEQERAFGRDRLHAGLPRGDGDRHGGGAHPVGPHRLEVHLRRDGRVHGGGRWWPRCSGPSRRRMHPPSTLGDAVVKPFMEFYQRGWPAIAGARLPRHLPGRPRDGLPDDHAVRPEDGLHQHRVRPHHQGAGHVRAPSAARWWAACW